MTASAHAEDEQKCAPSLTIPSVVFAAGASADWAVSYSVMYAHPGATEANPIVGWVGSRPNAMIAVGAGLDALELWGIRYAAQRWHHEKIARVVLYGLAAYRFSLAAGNLHLIPSTAPPGMR